MLILYDNLFAKSSLAGYVLASSGDAAGYPKENIADWLDFDFWKPDAAGTEYVQVDFTAAQAADTLAIYAHDIYTNGGSVKVRRYDSGAWTQVGATLTPTSNGLHIIQFASVSDTKWRIEVTSTPASKIGVGYLGVALVLPTPPVGFVPPLVPGTDTVTNRAAGGALLGVSGKPKTANLRVPTGRKTPAWMRTYWIPFMRHAARRAFIMAWLETSLSEAWWCWCEKPLENPEYVNSLYQQGELICKATDGI